METNARPESIVDVASDPEGREAIKFTRMGSGDRGIL
jgi:hypothetical protein